VVTELLARTGLDPSLVDRVVFGSVVQDVHAPNIAREIVLATPLPDTVDAYSVTRACATSTQATIDAAQAILLDDIDVAIVGGADSLSNPPVTFSPEFVDVMMAAQAARDLPTRPTILSRLRPRALAHNPPASADPSTGATMALCAQHTHVDSVVGVPPLTNPPVTFSSEFVDLMMAPQAARHLPPRRTILSRLRPRDLAPNPPAIADRSTGETMGQGAEKMARDWGITREE